MRDLDMPGHTKLFILQNTADEWFVESPRSSRGPYRNAVVALQVAAFEVMAARRRAMNASMAVKDDYGDVRLCQLMDTDDGTKRCGTCQRSWLATNLRPLEPRCPLCAALEQHRISGMPVTQSAMLKHK